MCLGLSSISSAETATPGGPAAASERRTETAQPARPPHRATPSHPHRPPTALPDRVQGEPFPTQAQTPVPRWLEEVRAQRRALQQQRRAAHQARHEALDAIGAAKREERKEQIERRRQEVREFIAQERRLYLNRGPWIAPLAPHPPPIPGLDPLAGGSAGDGGTRDPVDASEQPAVPAPSDWDNRWYYNGW